MIMDQKVYRKTLFIKNIDETTTSKQLEDCFSEVGPIRKCFVVKEKGSEKCRGFGYVTYSLWEDAQKAIEKIKTLNGRRLQVTIAKDKLNPREKKKEIGGDLTGGDVKEEEKVKEDSGVKLPLKKRPKLGEPLNMKTLASTVVLSLGNAPTLSSARALGEDDFKQLLKSCGLASTAGDIKYTDGDVNKCHISFASKKDATAACNKLRNQKINGRPVSALLLSQDHARQSKKFLRNCRLIVRNLSFQIKEELLRNVFGKFGEVTEIVIPTKSDGKPCGFAFVQYGGLREASLAVKEMNAKKILGRPVAVDWAVPKAKFQKEAGDTSTLEKESDKSALKETKDEKVDRDESFAEVSDDDDDDSDDIKSDIGDDSRHGNVAGTRKRRLSDESGSSDDDSEEDDDDDNDEDDDKEDDDAMQTKRSKQTNVIKRPSDACQGQTVHVKNVSFDSSEESLHEFFANFGKIRYCKMVLDPNMDHPRGTAFIKFLAKDSADKCLKTFSDSTTKVAELTLDGRRLYAELAISQEEVARREQAKKESKEKTDNRNLYLCREGLIRPNTPAAEGLSQEDLARRAKIEMVNRVKLKNPEVFVSLTRLCVHNLPVNVDDKELKRIMVDATADKSAKVVECRVMRDMKNVNSQGVAKSRGYAFVAFNEHKHALRALRELNNNPKLFGADKRPIVEFSLENKAALQARDKRRERAQAKQALLFAKNSGGSKKGGGSGHSNVLINNVRKGKKQKKEEKAEKVAQQISVEEYRSPAARKLKGLPKLRHKPRWKGPGSAAGRGEKKEGKKKEGEVDQTKKEKNKKKNSKHRKRSGPEKTDRFDKLVRNYQTKISSAVEAAKGKWFES